MARIRSIHPGLFTDEAFLELTTDEPLAIAMLLGVWCESDDHGVFEWKPLRFKMRIIGATNADAGKLLDVLASVGFVRRFEDGGKTYGACRNFCKWQRPKTPQYLYPFPDEVALFTGFKETAQAAGERGVALRRMLWERQDGRCHYCAVEVTFYRKKTNSLEIDHRTPVSRGGEDRIDNLVAACRECNSLKGSMTEEEFRSEYVASELSEIHSSRRAKVLSEGARRNSRRAKPGFRPPKDISRSANGSETDFREHSQSPEEEMSPQREEGGGRKESKKGSELRSAADGGAKPPPDVRNELWAEGLTILRGVIGKSDQQSRALLGKLLKTANDDCAVVLDALRRAADLRPVDPISWITRAVEPRLATGRAYLEIIAEGELSEPLPLQILGLTHVH